MNNPVVAVLGENLALNFLKKNKCKILHTNYKNKLGEIDIICLDKKTKETVFVEVKSRSSLEFGLPSEAVDERKQFKIKKTASLYMLENKIFEDKIRFDVVEILNNEVLNYIKHAF